VGDRRGLVEHREYVSAGNLGVAPAGEEFGEPVTVLRWHDLVVGATTARAPRPGSPPAPRCGGSGSVHRRCCAIGEQVASDAALAEHRFGPAVDELVGEAALSWRLGSSDDALLVFDLVV
jgi:hypothetical protein